MSARQMGDLIRHSERQTDKDIQRQSDEGGGDWSESSIPSLDGVGSSSVWRTEWRIEPLPHLADMNPKTGLYPLSN